MAVSGGSPNAGDYVIGHFQNAFYGILAQWLMVARAVSDTEMTALCAYADAQSLAGYEFRMCYRLWEVTDDLQKSKKLSESERLGWIERFCVDMTTRQIFFPQDYHRVQPFNRVFIWPKDANDAAGKLNLTPG